MAGIVINPQKREAKPKRSRQNGKRSTTQQMNKNYLPDLPTLSNSDGGERGNAFGNGPSVSPRDCEKGSRVVSVSPSLLR